MNFLFTTTSRLFEQKKRAEACNFCFLTASVSFLKKTKTTTNYKIMAYYNTTNETGRKLKDCNHRAETQEEKVMNIFRKSKRGLTPGEVWQLYLEKNVPLTSIRRAITNLMNDKKLVKTRIKREGIYGRPETEYQLYTGQMVMFN